MLCGRCGSDSPSASAFCLRCGAPLALEHLRAYLPAPLADALQLELRDGAASSRLLGDSLSRLARLVARTRSHLPAYLVEAVAQDPVPGAVGGAFVEGTLLFADISGFTAMSESLSRIGKEGAEEVTTIVNGYFNVMLAILREWGGQLIKFGGDALLGLFLEPMSAARAAQAALDMQAAMGRFAQTRTSQGTFPLYMKVAVHRGRFFAARLGSADNMEYALFGADVNATAAGESAAVAGQVLLDQSTLAALDVPAQSAPVVGNDGYHVVERLLVRPPAASGPGPAAPLVSASEPSLDNLRRALALLDALTPYLPEGLLTRLSGNTQTVELEGEHRLVAVVFANVHGLGDLADRLGPGREAEITAALNAYFTAMDATARGLGGVVNKIDLYDHGDKLLTFFGAPIAHEDDAERAVRAALAMQALLNPDGERGPSARTGELAAPARPLPADIRQQIGLTYGYVFAGYVGADWQREYTVMGDEVNLAARLMSVAETGSVAVSQSVRRKVQALFDLTPQGSVKLKGKSAPIPIFSVMGPRTIPEQVQGLAGMRSPLVGRTTEWDRLDEALERLLAGHGQIMSVTGEAGMGKSRLVAEMRQRVAGGPRPAVHWVEGRCLSYTESVSYFPMREVMRQLLGLRPDDGEAEAWNTLRQSLADRLPPEDARANLPYLANFLGLPLDEAQQEKVRFLDAEALQRRTFIAIRQLIEAQARADDRPLVVAVDDIQWLDQASLALVDYLMPLVEQIPLMLLLLYRPERESACWQIHERAAREFSANSGEIALARLSSADSHELLTNLLPLEPWPAALQELILSRTEGNPLYVEELVRVLVDDGVARREADGWRVTGNLEALKVPDTLEGVMMTRLDRLGEACRHTTQVASVVGRLFLFDILMNVVPEANRTGLNQCLGRIQQHEIARETQRTPELVYSFRHGLMQEVCYGSLLTRTRRLYHRKIAGYLDASLGDAETSYALIAHHAFVGQDWHRALHYEVLAGRQAQQLFANHEAIDHFERALQSADHLARPDEAAAHAAEGPGDAPAVDSAWLLEQRQMIHAALGELLTTTGQYDRGLEHLDRARSLAAERGDVDAQARACRWLARRHELRGEYPPAITWLQHGLAVLGVRETAEAAQLRLIAGLIHRRRGDKESAAEQAREALRIARGLGELAVLARAYNLLGLVHLRSANATAIEHFQRALELYQQAGDVPGQATAHNLMGNAFLELGQWPAAERAYRQARATFDQMGDVYHRAFADNNLGEIALKQGRLDEAVAFYQEALRTLERIGGSAYVLGALRNNLGAAFIRRGDAEAARQHLAASQEYFAKAQARDFLAELHRHLAEAALLAGDWAAGEAGGQQALSLARDLGLRNEEGTAWRALGEISAAQDLLEQAEERLCQSVVILDEAGEEYEGARSRLALARVYISAGKTQAARMALAQCEAVFKRLEASLDLRQAGELLGQLG